MRPTVTSLPRNLGYHIHPSIAPRLHASSRIADIGTGTGIFLIELSEQLPATCQLDGFDVSNALYPPAATLPANVSLALQDARHAFPTPLKQAYDFINIRLLVSGMDKDDWAVVTANAIQLLKPGGAIQWIEADFLQSKILSSCAGTTPEALEYVGRRFHEGMGHRLRYGHCTLPALFEQQALLGVFQDFVQSDRVPETREALTRVSYEGIFGWAYQVSQKGVPGAWTLDEIERLRKKCEDELTTGGYCKYTITVTVGYTSRN